MWWCGGGGQRICFRSFFFSLGDVSIVRAVEKKKSFKNQRRGNRRRNSINAEHCGGSGGGGGGYDRADRMGRKEEGEKKDLIFIRVFVFVYAHT